MGDISELRTLVVVSSFLILTVTLIGIMYAGSPQLFVDYSQFGTSPMKTDVNNTAVNPGQIIAWNDSMTIPLNKTASSLFVTFGFGGFNFRLYTKIPYGVSQYAFQMQVFDYFLFYEYNQEDLTWYNSTNDRVSVNNVPFMAPFGNEYPEVMLLEEFDHQYAWGNSSSSMGNLVFTLRGRTKLTMSIYFNNTEYYTPSDCYLDGGNLYLVFNINWSDRNTSVNALTFISMLFTFQLPGINPVIVGFIMSPIYVALAYLAFIFVLRMVGAVFGGGGA